MAKQKQDSDTMEENYQGCYGEKVSYSQLFDFLGDVFVSNSEAEENNPSERFATCIWGASGIGKTGIIKQFSNVPVVWRGKSYPGYSVHNVPIAQFEEMGDLHGMPSRHIRMIKTESGTVSGNWVPEEVVQAWVKDGWEIDRDSGVKTMYAPPDWVPREPGPSILLLDDWNRAGSRIIKGIMQLLQNYSMVSWSLPPGCNIVMTANPDEQSYLVTSIDTAILTRFRSVTLKTDAKEWAVWAQKDGLDTRGISFILKYPEMMMGNERTNPRTLAQCFRDIKRVKGTSTKEDILKLKTIAASLLDEQTVSSLLTFFQRDVELIIEPEQILEGKDFAGIEAHMAKLMTGTEQRIDVVSVICDRLFAYLVQPNTDPTTKRVENFQKFLLLKEIPDDMRHSLCLRLSRVNDKGKSCKWILHNQTLQRVIMEVL